MALSYGFPRLDMEGVMPYCLVSWKFVCIPFFHLESLPGVIILSPFLAFGVSTFMIALQIPHWPQGFGDDAPSRETLLAQNQAVT